MKQLEKPATFKYLSMIQYTSNDVKIEFGDVSLNFPNVQNYEDFMKKAQRDNRFEKMVQEMTLGQSLGRSSLNKLQF